MPVNIPRNIKKPGIPYGGIGAERQDRRAHSLILDDRLLSKQYVTGRVDSKVSDVAYGDGSLWADVSDVAPSKGATQAYLASLTINPSHWTQDGSGGTAKSRTVDTGFVGIGAGAGLAYSDITERLTVDGNVKCQNIILGSDGLADIKFPDDDGQSDDVSMIRLGGRTNAPKYAAFRTTVSIDGKYDAVTQSATTGYPSLWVTSGNFKGNGHSTLDERRGVFCLGPITDNTGGNANTMELGFGPGTNTYNIQARAAGAAKALTLNYYGGDMTLGNGSSTITAPGNMTVGGNTTIAGNLTVTGTATAVMSETVNIQDNLILLNSNETGTPSADAGIEIERGTSGNRKLFWDESEDKWMIETADNTYTQIAGGGGTLTGTNTGDVTIVLASGVPTGAVVINNQAVTLGDKFVYNEGTANTIGVDGGSDGKLSLFGTEGNSGTTGLEVKGGSSGSSNPAVKITGALEATTKSFNIPHPIDSNKRLVYGCLEGPEYGMYQRGSFLVNDERRIVAIDLPNYWFKMVYEDYAINITTYGDYNVWINNRDENGFWVETNAEGEWSFDWSVIGGRKDAKLVVEPDA